MNPTADKNRRAATLLITGLLLVVAPNRASGQPRSLESPSNIECLEHLEIPDYPPLARAGRFQGAETVKVVLSDQATVQGIEYIWQRNAVNLESFFKAGAERALKNSRFSKTCSGKTVTLVFHYELLDDDANRSLFAFDPPNQFWIRSGPVLLNPNVSAK